MHWNKKVSTFLNYSYQRFNFTEDDPATPENEDGQRMTTSPEHKLNGGVRLLLDSGFSGQLWAHYVSSTFWQEGNRMNLETTLDDYVLVNVRVAYRFYEERAELAVTGYNLVHDKHKEFPLGDEIGSRASFSLHLDF